MGTGLIGCEVVRAFLEMIGQPDEIKVEGFLLGIA